MDFVLLEWLPLFTHDFRVITNIILKEDNVYRVKIGDIPQCAYPDLTKMSSQALGNKGEHLYCKHLYYVLKFVCKVNYNNDMFIHAPPYIYNNII